MSDEELRATKECARKMCDVYSQYPPRVTCKALEACLAAEVRRGYGGNIVALLKHFLGKFHEEWKTLSPSTDEIQ